MCSVINRRRGVKRREQFPIITSQFKKHRQLDECQFTPIFEDEVESRLLLDQSVDSSGTRLYNDDVVITDVRETRPLSDFSGNSALVLFKPPDLLMRSPCCSKLEIKVHPDLVDAMREYQYQITSAYIPEAKEPSTAPNLAVIPWVNPNMNDQTRHPTEPIEADNDLEMMDTEECKDSLNNNEGFQPQHCLPPQVSQSIASPIRWW